MRKNSNRAGRNVPMRTSTKRILNGIFGILGGLLLLWAALFESVYVKDNGKYLAIFGGLMVVVAGILNLIEGIKKIKE